MPGVGLHAYIAAPERQAHRRQEQHYPVGLSSRRPASGIQCLSPLLSCDRNAAGGEPQYPSCDWHYLNEEGLRYSQDESLRSEEYSKKYCRREFYLSMKRRSPSVGSPRGSAKPAVRRARQIRSYTHEYE
jgi:hypothetical protein